MNTLSLTSRRLLSLAAFSAASFVWGEDAPANAGTPDQTPAPPVAAAPAVAPATTSADQILPAADPNSPTGTTLAGILSGNSTAVSAIQRLEISQRGKLFAELSNRVQTADRRVSELQQKTGSLNPNDQKALEKAVSDYNQAKAKFQKSLEKARAAQPDTWERSRSTLATDYAFFVAAAGGVELASPTT